MLLNVNPLSGQEIGPGIKHLGSVGRFDIRGEREKGCVLNRAHEVLLTTCVVYGGWKVLSLFPDKADPHNEMSS